MALGVSPERVREVRFAEQWRGYRTDEVDDFVEQVAEALDRLEAEVREATVRASDAERRLLERGPDDDLSRTLILAQRTADAAEREAEAEAERILGSAQERARLLVEAAESRRTRLEVEIEARIASELRDLTDRRESLEKDVASLASFVEHERRRLAVELRGQLAWLERPGHLEPASPSEELVAGTFVAALAGIVTGDDPQLVDDEIVQGPATLLGTPPQLDDAVRHEGERHDRGPGTDDTVLHDLVVVPDEGQPENAVPHGVPAGDLLPGGQEPQGLVPEDLLPQVAGPEDAVSGPRTSDPSDISVYDDASVGSAGSGDDAVLDGLDLPWRSPPADDGKEGKKGDGPGEDAPDPPTTSLDDPFLAELRRAVNDPEPLGPRDASESDDWGESRDLYDKGKSSPRFRRRRPR